MLTYKEFRKKLLTELDQRGIKFEITSMTSVNLSLRNPCLTQ